ncbi:MAG: YncE family protein, partial [Muribaculaceae bacterium]|nr:YncE family protein [Muribaculaceae bacterium]
VIDDPKYSSESLIVVNAGNFTYSNASITLWNKENGASNEVFFKANDFKLGDVAQSATVHGNQTWIVVNNSNVIFIVDTETFKEVGRIDEGLTSPRYVHFVSDNYAYVTQMYCNQIAVVNTKTLRIIGYMNIPVKEGSIGVGSSEEIVQIGDDAYVNLWSYDNRIVVVDTKSNNVTSEINVGLQPYSIAKDYDNNLWVLCDGGGWAENPVGYEAPVLMCLDPWSRNVKKMLSLPLGDSVSKLAVNGDGTKLYFIQNHYAEDWSCTSQIIEVDARSDNDWSSAVVTSTDKQFYSLTVSPITGDIFVADAVDYSQAGVIYHYSSDGRLQSSFTAGIIPTAYAWVLK